MNPRRHSPDGRDARGEGLDLVIRIGPDGALYFHDVTADLLPVALAVCPHDEGLRARAAAMAAFEEGSAR